MRWGGSMKCQRCNGGSRVLETREPKRRRVCSNDACGHRWSTVEVSLTELHAPEGLC